MATFRIKVVNETFNSVNEHEAESADEARAEALKAALQIGTDEVIGGTPFFAAEVRVDCADQTVGRFVVSVGASPLIVDE